MLNALRSGERGSALVPAMLVMVLLLTFGIATAAHVDADQGDSRRERERESSFQLTEGALNAQIYQLSTRWPSKTAETPYPGSCTAGAAIADCPSATAMQQSFTGVDYSSGTAWVTQVRDNGGVSSNHWSDGLLASQPTYDANDDNFLWVRASGIVNGRQRTLVALVEAENVALNFPRATLVSGHFTTSNSGNKIIIDTNGEADEFTPGDIIVRCALTAPDCATYRTDSANRQIAPDTVQSNPLQPRAVSLEGLEQLRARAQADGNYYARCAPSLAGDQPGEVVFMEDASGCQYNANATYNTVAEPGYVVIARGAMDKINGNATFHGIIYHANLDQSTADLVTLTGNVSVFGSIVIDGPGGLSAGSSSVNLVYDPNVISNFRAFGTVGIVQNTFREITPGT
jgi:Tfp pilus assembly protein PilX